MAFKYKDHTGLSFGKLTVLYRCEDFITNSGKRRIQWMCKCACGKKVVCRGESLVAGDVKTCGCHRHGMTNHPIYRVWAGMIRRCLSPKAEFYSNYGGRGIKVCARWRDFKNFYADMGAGYRKGLSIERVDVDGDYCLDNCRWADSAEQSLNKTNTVKVTIKGKEMPLLTAVKDYGSVRYKTALNRLRKGWSDHDAVMLPDQRLSKNRVKQ